MKQGDFNIQQISMSRWYGAIYGKEHLSKNNFLFNSRAEAETHLKTLQNGKKTRKK